ncbi:MAG TPA: hypothetical protein PKD48_03580 [Sphingopyxis sp.]|nr:hypothetical protein [Sphingopyxis sp.]
MLHQGEARIGIDRHHPGAGFAQRGRSRRGDRQKLRKALGEFGRTAAKAIDRLADLRLHVLRAAGKRQSRHMD